MIKYKIKYSPHFKRELRETYNYIRYHLNSPNAAKSLLAKIKDYISSLSLFPEGYILSFLIVSIVFCLFILFKLYLIIINTNTNTHIIEIIIGPIGKYNFGVSFSSNALYSPICSKQS